MGTTIAPSKLRLEKSPQEKLYFRFHYRKGMKKKKTYDESGGQDISLTSDLLFKFVFGAQQSTHCLRSLLSAVQEDAGFPAVATVQITNPFNLQDFADDKLSIVDVKATDVTGATYTMEAQATGHSQYTSRALYYWAQAYSDQLVKGQFYDQLQPVIGINLLNFRLFPAVAKSPVRTTYQPYCRSAPQLPPLGDCTIHFIELPRFVLENKTPSTAFEKWLYYIKHRAQEDEMEDPILKAILEEDPEIQEAEERYQAFMADREMIDRLRAREKYRRDHLQRMHDAKQQGLQQGLEQGMKQGREEEKAKRYDAARQLKADGMAVEKIAEILTLPPEEIRQL